jgi:O-antigen/teichoic acid export membrane protein
MAASALAAGNLFLKIGSNFLIIPLSLRYLGRQEYAVWIILQSLSVYLALSEMGIGQTVVNFENVAYAQGDFDELNRIFTSVFGLYWAIVIPVWVVVTAVLVTMPVEDWFLKDVSASAATGFRGFLFLAGTLALIRVPLTVFTATLLGVRELVLRQIVDGVYAVYLLAGTVVALVAGGKILSLILVINLGLAVIMAGSYGLVKLRHPQVKLAPRYWSPAKLPALFGNSIFFFLYNLGLLFQRLAGNLLAGKLAALAEVPEMYVLLTLFRVVGWSLADIVSNTAIPYIIRMNFEGRWDRVVFFSKLATKFTFAVALGYTALIWFYADLGIRLWLGPGMFLGYGPLACLGAAFLIDVLYLSTNNFMRGLNAHRRLSLVMAGYAVLSFALGVAGAKLMPARPLFGLSAGLLAASVLGQGIPLLWLSARWVGLGFRKFLEPFIVRPGLLVLSLGVISLGGRLVNLHGPWGLAIETLAVVTVLPAVSWWMVFEAEERTWLTGLLAHFQLGEALK